MGSVKGDLTRGEYSLVRPPSNFIKERKRANWKHLFSQFALY